MKKEEKNTAIFIAFDEHEPFDSSVPEKNLLRAILLTAMADLQKEGEVGRKAIEYFLSPEEDYIFSFISICNFLDVDPNRILTASGLRDDQGRKRRRLPNKTIEIPGV